MSELLVHLANAATASYSGGDSVLTAEYLETCRGLLPIIGEQEARIPPRLLHLWVMALAAFSCQSFVNSQRQHLARRRVWNGVYTHSV